MNLDDYVKKETENRKNALPNWARAFYDIDTLNVTPQKRKLIKSFNNYIKIYDFNRVDPNVRPNYYKFPDQVMVQIKTEDNKTMCVFNILRERGEYSISTNVTEEEFKKLYKDKIVGSQEFYGLDGYQIANITRSCCLDYGRVVEWKDYYIFYSKDGKAFISLELVQGLSIISEDALGQFLAQKALSL